MKTATVALALTLSLFSPSFAGGSKAKPVPPSQALERLANGNNRFVSGKSIHPRQDRAQVQKSAKGQAPFAIILGCADSRVSPEVVFDQGIGDLFVVRTAGNTAFEEGIGSMEYAVAVLGSRLIVVMGHEACGAVDAARKGGELPGSIPSVVAPIQTSVEATKGQALNATIAENVRQTARLIREKSSIIADLEKSGELRIVGTTYQLGTGKAPLFRIP